MPKYLMLFFLIVIANVCISQDIITTMDKKVIQCKVLEVGIDKVRYKNINIKKSPIFEILKADISSIRYSNGYLEKHNTLSDNALEKNSTENIPDKTITRKPDEPIDTTKFAMIYFVFNSRSSEDLKFPIYFNGRYICTLKNYMRLQYKIFSEGELFIERKSKSYGEEPKTIIFIENGKSYGINIIVAEPTRWSPANIFDMVTINDSVEMKNFLENVFFGFKPFKNNDLKLHEDLNDLLIQ